jgi:siroheme synthase-like protein
MGRALYPMLADLAGRLVIVAGGGAVAERKVRRLLEAGASVTVVSPAATRAIERWAARDRLRLLRRPVRAGDLRGALLVFAATDDAAVNRRVALAAVRRGALVNVADDPAACSVLVPSVLRRGDLTIAVSTGGGSPALAKRLRERLEATIGPEYQAFLAALKELRAAARRAIPDSRDRQALFRRAMASPLYAEAARGDRRAVRARIAALVEEAAAGRSGASGIA